MKFETGLEFGRNAAVINEAYSKMNEADAVADDEVKDTKITADDFDGGSYRIHAPTKHRIPGWLKAAADKAGHDFDPELLKDEEEVADDSSNLQVKNNVDNGTIEDVLNGNFDASVPSSDDDGVESEEGEDNSEGDISAEDNFFQNVIMENPDRFNDEEYDMNALSSHKKELMDKAMAYMLKGVAPVEAAEKALEEIPGCECKIQQTDSEVSSDEETEDADTDIDIGESTEQSINEGAGAGYTITIKDLEIGDVTEASADETGGYLFTAKIVPGEYEVTADSYYDRYFPLGEYDDQTVQIDGGEIRGSIGYIDDGLEGEELINAINNEVKSTITVSTMYGAGWIHQFLPEDGKMTFDRVKVETPDVYFDVDDMSIDSKNMSEAINYGYEHCNDEEEDVDAEEVEDSVGNIDV